MTKLNLKLTSKPIVTYYADITQKRQAGFWTEGNVSPIFGTLLEHCAKSAGYLYNTEHTTKVGKRTIRFDAAILTQFHLRYGVWEAKDSADTLDKEIQKKFASGYPNDNILFQSPDQAVLIQDGREVMRADLTAPQALIDILNAFFSYVKPVYDEWERAVAEFKTRVPEIAQKLDTIIEAEYKKRGNYTSAFDTFHDLCRVAINPNLSKDAVEEMLIQHILTERIFRKVFNNDKFTSQNIIAKEIEKVVDALTSTAWNRAEFLRGLDHFYGAIEITASTISDYNEKQAFLNTVYEQFFQGFSVDVADTHGIVYTPQPIVQFMVRSVEQLLQREFGRSLADDGVHILDPFVGTGNFLLRVMEEIRQMNPSALPHKYANELHCNEIMLLPYYIASMNIEHAYYEAMNDYRPFEGICLVDTFELAEARQMGLFTQENLARVARQRASPLTVILGNPPYNIGQVNENDNNKNRTYPVIDGRVRDTYAKNSKATNRKAVYDAYAKSFRWASDRLTEKGIIAFVTNNSFIESIAFDGMRRHLAEEFDAIYILDLGGNARQSGRGEKVSSVFGIKVGVAITFLVKRSPKDTPRKADIYYYQIPETGNKGDKLELLTDVKSAMGITWQHIIPTRDYLWLTSGLDSQFETLMLLGEKVAKKPNGNGRDHHTIFKTYSRGLETTRDSWVYNFNLADLQENVIRFIETYNSEVDRWHNRIRREITLDNFILSDNKRIKWSSRLKECLVRGQKAIYDVSRFRTSLYRPFTKSLAYFDDILNHRQGLLPYFLPTPATEAENRVICVAGIGDRKGFGCLITNTIPSLDLAFEKAQCFPLYVYDADGTNRRDNISDWALGEYRAQYGDDTIGKEDIFYSIYALLHHPQYREKYAQNLKRELPRVPMVKGHTNIVGTAYMPSDTPQGDMPSVPMDAQKQDAQKRVRTDISGASAFHHLAKMGRDLADLHLNYETLPEYGLVAVQNPKVPPLLRVEVMRLNKDKTELVVNESLTLTGIPTRVYDYKLGNRSALEWVIDQYRISEDKRSGIINDPNRADDAGYIVRLVKQVVHISLETLRLVDDIAKMGF